MNDKQYQDQLSAADIRHSNLILPIRMLSMAQVESKIGLGRTKIYEMMASGGDFPQSHSIGGGRAKRFVENEIDQWLLHQIQKSRTEPNVKAKVGVKLSSKGDAK